MPGLLHNARSEVDPGAQRDWRPLFGQRPTGLVIFETEAKDAAAMRRRDSVQCVRVVDTRLVVKLP
jgi:hypothetical protein